MTAAIIRYGIQSVAVVAYEDCWCTVGRSAAVRSTQDVVETLAMLVYQRVGRSCQTYESWLEPDEACCQLTFAHPKNLVASPRCWRCRRRPLSDSDVSIGEKCTETCIETIDAVNCSRRLLYRIVSPAYFHDLRNTVRVRESVEHHL